MEDSIFGIEKGCERTNCPMNDGSMCTSPMGCMYYEVDFLNSMVGKFGEVDSETFKNFIR